MSTAPWMRDSEFPAKPGDSLFGYTLWRVRELDNEAGLNDAIRRHCGKPWLAVWSPQQGRILPPLEVASFYDAAKSAWKTNTRRASVFSAVVFSLLIALQVPPLLDADADVAVRSQSVLALLSFLMTLAFLGWDLFRSLRWSPSDEKWIREISRLAVWIRSRPGGWRNAICVMLILIFAAQLIVDRSLPWPEKWLSPSAALAGASHPYVYKGEWWLILTGGLLHHNVDHLLGNLLSLLVLSTQVGGFAASAAVALIVALGIVTGGLLSLLAHPTAISVGISAGISALMGFLLMVYARRRGQIPTLFLIACAISICLGFAGDFASQGRIDVAAHAGGMIAGIILGALLIRRDDPTLPIPISPRVEMLGNACGALLIATGVGVLGIFAHALLVSVGFFA